MRFNTRFFAMIAVAVSLCATGTEAQRGTKKPPSRPSKTPTRPVTTPTPAPAAYPSPVVVDERELYLSAARTAWAFVDRNYQPATGLVRGHDTYQYVTIWDVASALAATISWRPSITGIAPPGRNTFGPIQGRPWKGDRQ